MGLALLTLGGADVGGSAAAASDDGQGSGDQPPGLWQQTAPPTAGRTEHAAVRLDERHGGGVLVTGGTTSESGQDATAVYNLPADAHPAPGESELEKEDYWDESVAPLNYARRKHHMVKFADGPNAGHVLVVGGNTGVGQPPQPEIYNPVADEWVTGPPAPFTKIDDATLLYGPECDEAGPPRWCDTVLVVGLAESGPEAALFDPSITGDESEPGGTWRQAADPKGRHMLTSLKGPSVLGTSSQYAGADDPTDLGVCGDHEALESCDELDVAPPEMFDPTAGGATGEPVGQWTETAQLNTPRNEYSVTRLADGRVLVAGGWRLEDDGTVRFVQTGELYQPAADPTDAAWHETGDSQPRASPESTLLDDGTVLLAGGDLGGNDCLSSTELFDPDGNDGQGAFIQAGHMSESRDTHTLNRLDDGRVLAVGSSGTCDDENKGKTSADVYTPSYANPPEAPPPDIAEVKPNTEGETGGTRVTIIGSGFVGVSEVSFGESEVPPEDVTVESHTKITTRAPAGQPGTTVPIQVTTPRGTSSERDPQAAFTYVEVAGVWTQLDDKLPSTPNGAGVPGAVILGAGDALALYTDEQGDGKAVRYDPQNDRLNDVPDPPTTVMLTAPLSDGRALVVGDGTAAVYDPEAGDTGVGEWRQTLGPPLFTPSSPPRGTATLLSDGRVLVVAATRSGARSQVYDPDTDRWRLTDGQPEDQNIFGTSATRLPDGDVLTAGGGAAERALTSKVQRFDPDSETWTQPPPMADARGKHAAVRLADGRVLVAGGQGVTGAEQSAETFTPDAGVWAGASSLGQTREQHTLTRLPDGSVLAVGGDGSKYEPLARTEVMPPDTGQWQPTGPLNEARYQHAAVAMDTNCGTRCGSALVFGDGGGPDRHRLTSVELYTPQPQVTGVEPASAPVGSEVTITGHGLAGVDEVAFGDTPADFTMESPGTTEAAIVATVPGSLSVDERVHITVTNHVSDGGAELTSSASNADLFWVDPPMSGGGDDQQDGEQDGGGQDGGEVEAAELPGQVGDLAAEALSAEEIKLTWTAVGDGAGASAPGYVVKQSPTPITDEADFADAFALCGGVCEPDPVPQVGGDLSLTVLDLQPDTTYYYAVRARSAAGELGPVSNVARATTPAGETAAGDTGGEGAGRELVEAACGDNVPAASFTDRDAIPQAHRLGVNCAAAQGVVAGFADGSYRPGVGVRRDQMVSFIARSLQAADVALPEPGQDRFVDVAADSVHGEAIHRLAAAGIVAGGPGQLSDNRYGPGQVIRRDQMASFLIRAAEFATGEQLAAGRGGGRFADVPASNVHADQLSAAAALDLAQGYPDGTYRPAQQVRRDQMATFVTRLLGSLTNGSLASG